MNKTQQLSDRDFTDAGGDALFDDEATVLAQPVVPLGAQASDAPEEMTVVAGSSAGPGAPALGVLTAARRPTTLALVLVSALVGAVIGGTALYILQRGRTAPAQTNAPAQPQAVEAPTTTDAAPAENQQPAAQNSEQPAPPAPQDSQPSTPAAETRPAAAQEQQPLAEHPGAHEPDDDRADDGRRNRRRGRDDDYERDAPLEHAAERRRGDGAIDTQAPIPDDASPASRRAARVEEALRRVEDNRRARRARRVGVLH